MAILIALVCVAVIIFLIIRWDYTFVFFKHGIPGPNPNLLFGNLLELYWKGPLKCHEEWVKKYGRVLGYFYGMKAVLLVTDPVLLKKIFIKDFPKFINREPFGPLQRYDPKNKDTHSVIVLPGQEWKSVRSVLTPTFTSAKMKQMAGSISSSIDAMIAILREQAEKGREVELHGTYQRLTLDVITRTAFGVRTDVLDNAKSQTLTSVQMIFRTPYRDPILFLGLSFPLLRTLCSRLQFFLLGILNRGVNPIKYLRNGLKEVLQHRRNNPQAKKSDLLQIMIDTKIATGSKEIDVTQLEAGSTEKEENNEVAESTKKMARTMTDGEVLSTSLTVLLAGYETTSTALAFTAYLLAKHQDVQEKLFQEINGLIEKGEVLEYSTVNRLPYLEQVFCESMRLYPPVTLFTNRYAVEDVQYDGLKISKGTLIQAPVYLIHHDPEFWTEPEKFDPDRFSSKQNTNGITYLPFGVGPRNCLGMRFAQLEAKLALAHTIYNFRIRLSEKQKATFKIGLRMRTITPASGVRVKLESRNLGKQL